MLWFWQHGNQLFILFLTPLLGLIFDYTLSKKVILYLLGTSVVLFLPIVAGYEYIIPYTVQALGLTALSCLYYFYSRQITQVTPKIISAILIGGLAFIVLKHLAFMDSMSGYQKVEKSWNVNHHKIEYIVDQGFSGRPLLKYEIRKYGLIPIVLKKVDRAYDDDTTNSCIVHFTDI
ncbi:hypothetical protein [Xanthocytophaga agilis]|uniref:Uncharacterized protein n=1 Tax=Xanthocytophaga agilis TaxID=3048010 RepID=A0AAE3RC16_9BACT|nr:hypothetical protein [Xanthocytophaga agilis]MDJ1505414.1 hypothetical protein [Xanthocytophaga agilis]